MKPTQPRNSKEIVIYHIGGEGDYGPAMEITKQMFPHVHLVIFEARSGTDDFRNAQNFTKEGLRTTLIFKGIDERIGQSQFHVNKFPLSSSLLPCSSIAERESPVYSHCHTWGENAQLDHLIKIDTVSLDDVIAMGEVPPPDVISIDAQGAELRILRGATQALSQALCVVTEVEFFEIYESQGLFDDQMHLLSEQGYRLFDIMNKQFWHPGPAVGRGFLTVGEAIFLRYAGNLPKSEGTRGYVQIETLSDWQLLRLSGIALSFKLLGYVYTLGKALRQRNPALFDELRSIPQYARISELVGMVEKGREQYQRDPLYWITRMKGPEWNREMLWAHISAQLSPLPSQKIVCYGAGNDFVEFLSSGLFESHTVIAVVDNYRTEGELVRGVPVIREADLIKSGQDAIVVTSSRWENELRSAAMRWAMNHSPRTQVI